MVVVGRMHDVFLKPQQKSTATFDPAKLANSGSPPASIPQKLFHVSAWYILTLGFQTPGEEVGLDPQNIPKTPVQEVFGRLG